MSFKPYYKWITFNTKFELGFGKLSYCFKPYYKWITFNTLAALINVAIWSHTVLNLIINGLPSIQ